MDLNARVGYHRVRDLFLREDFVPSQLEISFPLCCSLASTSLRIPWAEPAYEAELTYGVIGEKGQTDELQRHRHSMWQNLFPKIVSMRESGHLLAVIMAENGQ
jgi:hypothetical protein